MNRRQLFQSLASVGLAIVGVRLMPKPGYISPATVARLKAYWEASFSGARVQVLGDGLTYSASAYSDEDIIEAFHVPTWESSRRQKLFARHVMHNIKGLLPRA